MNAREKRRQELDEQIESRKDDIKTAAINEFIKTGIDNAKLSDIAKSAEVGEATVYRYFENKTGLVIECAMKLWSGEMSSLIPQIASEGEEIKNGYERVREILILIGSLFNKCPHLLKLMEEFDNYIMKENVPKTLLKNYESNITDTEDVFMKALEKGKSDGSIRRDLDSKLFYTTSTHSLTSLSQKLLLRGSIISSDIEISAEKQIKSLIEMELLYIKS